MSTIRLQKIAKEIQRLVSEKIFSLGGSETITITDVVVSPKYQHARVFFVPFGAASRSESESFVTANAYVIKKYLAQRLGLRYAIEPVFVFDDSIERGNRMDKLLSEIAHPNVDDLDQPELKL